VLALAYVSLNWLALLLSRQIWSLVKGHAVDWTNSFVAAGVTGTLAAIGASLRRRDRLRVQATRDKAAPRIADEVYERARSGQEPCFALYIRPFTWTGMIPVLNPEYSPWQNPFRDVARLDLEELLQRALDPVMPMIALGDPGTIVGAGRIQSQHSDWENRYVVLASAATLIVCMPLGSDTVAWEMAQVVKMQGLSRTVFIMPPLRGRFASLMPMKWAQSRNALAEIGIRLPPYSRAGRILAIHTGDGWMVDMAFPSRLEDLATVLLSQASGTRRLEPGWAQTAGQG
jgi:hypothetical protein